MKRISVLLMVMVLLVGSMNVPVKAQDQADIKYVALGDSVALGVGASVEENGYVEQFARYLDNNFGDVRVMDHSDRGLTIGELAVQLQTDPQVIQDVLSADIITISIGGNELLQPVLGSLEVLVNFQDPAELLAVLGEFLEFSEMMALMSILYETLGSNTLPGLVVPVESTPVLQQVMTAESIDACLEILYDTLGEEKYNRVLGIFKTAMNRKLDEMDTGASLALKEILTGIRMANPQGVIYVNNLYNPFEENKRLAGLIDPFIQVINDAVNDAVAAANWMKVLPAYPMPLELTFCYVVDIYQAFQLENLRSRPLVHNIPQEYMVNAGTLLAFINGTILQPMAAGQTLPPLYHPTDNGYGVIYQEHTKTMMIRELKGLIEAQAIIAGP